jgi:iduronate 2-sulfatase
MKSKYFLLIIIFSARVLVAQQTPNIIFIEADDLMPRFLNKLGEGFGHTPNIDKLASQGVYLSSAVAQGPMCGPSRNGMLTDLYSHNLGFYKNGDLKMLPKNIWTFPKVLQKAGYQTAYIGKSHIRPINGKKSKTENLKLFGFDYANATGERYALWKALKNGKNIDDVPYIQYLKKRGKYEQFVKDNSGTQAQNRSTMEEDVDYLDGFTTQVAVDWLKKNTNSKKPFFLWFNFCLPHGPYDVPQRYFDIAETKEIPAPKTTTFGHPVPEPLLRDNKPATPKSIAKNRVGEVANVAFLDKMVGNLISSLEENGQLDNTVIVFFSDHSIFLGNHGRKHKSSLFEETLNTSLIICYPKKFPKDVIVESPVELLDLIPTTFELAGIKNPNKVALNGVSLVPLLEGKKTSVRKYAFSEIWGGQGATDGRYRYIISEEYEILYDHENDPYEMVNIAVSSPKITKRFRIAVENWMKNSGPVYNPKTF